MILAVTRFWYKDREEALERIKMTREITIPCMKAQTHKDLGWAFIVNPRDKDLFEDIEIHGKKAILFFTLEEFHDYVVKHQVQVQTRLDSDDWIAPNYFKAIARALRKYKKRPIVVHFKVLKWEYPNGRIYERKKQYKKTLTSMFLTLAQDKVVHDVYVRSHNLMAGFIKNVITLPTGYCRWVMHKKQAHKGPDGPGQTKITLKIRRLQNDSYNKVPVSG